MSLGEELRTARLKQKLTPSQVAALTRMKVQIVDAIEREDFSHMPAPIYGKGFIRLYAELVALDPAPLIDEYMARFVEAQKPSLVREPEPEPEPEPEAEAPGEPAAQAPEEETAEEAMDLFARAAEQDEPGEAPAPDEAKPPAARPAWVRTLTEASREAAKRWTASAEALTRTASRRWERLAAAGRARAAGQREFWQTRSRSLREIRFSETPLKVVSVIVGIVILLVFAISGLSRCARQAPGRQAGADERDLMMVVDPPSPYLE